MNSIAANLERNAGPNKTLVFGQTLDWLIAEEKKPDSNAHREFLNLEFCCNYGINDPVSGKIILMPEDSFQEQAASHFGCGSDYKAYLYLGECINCLFCQSSNSKTVVFIAVWPPGDGSPDGGDNMALSQEILLGLFDETDIRCLSPGHRDKICSDISVVVMESLFRSANAILSVRNGRFHNVEKENERSKETTPRVNHMKWSDIEWNDLVPRLQLYVARKLGRICYGTELYGKSVDDFVTDAIVKVMEGGRKPCEDDLNNPLKYFAGIIDSDISHLCEKHKSRTIAIAAQDTFEIKASSELNDYIRKNNNAGFMAFTQSFAIALAGKFLSRWDLTTSDFDREDAEDRSIKWGNLPKIEANLDGKDSRLLIWIFRNDSHSTDEVKRDVNLANTASNQFSLFTSDDKESTGEMIVEINLPNTFWGGLYYLDAEDAGLVTNIDSEFLGAEFSSDEMGEARHRANTDYVVNHNELGMAKSFGDLITAYIRSINEEGGSVEDIFYDTFAEEWRGVERNVYVSHARGKYDPIAEKNSKARGQSCPHGSLLGWADSSGRDYVDLKHSGDGETEGAALLTARQQSISSLGQDLFGTTRSILDLREGPSNDQLSR